MRLDRRLAWAIVFFLFACQPTPHPTVTIIDTAKVITLQTDERVPFEILKQASITLTPNDRVLLNGLPVAVDQSITNYPVILQVRHAITLTIKSSDGEKQIQSSALTVGEALQEAGIHLSASD